jgi:hypothetical protein
MKVEDLIIELEKLPEGTDVFVVKYNNYDGGEEIEYDLEVAYYEYDNTAIVR